jgi:hypothetical protein
VGKPLKDWDVTINRGVLTGYNEAFIIDTATKEQLCAQDPKSAEILKPILRGKDIERYGYKWAGLWLINSHNGLKKKNIPAVNIDAYPAVKQYLDRYFDAIHQRQDQGNTPYNLRNCAYLEEFDKPKIAYMNMTKDLLFGYDETGIYTNQKCFIMTGQHLKYLLAFFNTALFRTAYKDNFPMLQGGTRELSKIYMVDVRIPVPSPDQEQAIVQLVDQVLADKALGQDTKGLEQHIDDLIRQLYGI